LKRIWIILGAVVCCVAAVCIWLLVPKEETQPLPLPEERQYVILQYFENDKGVWVVPEEVHQIEILQKLSTAKGQKDNKWTYEKVKEPVIGIEIHNGKGLTYTALTNGYLVFEDGSAYRTDLELQQWIKQNNVLEGGREYDAEEYNVDPMRYIHTLAKSKFGWRMEYLYPSPEMEPAPEGIKMQLQSWTQEEIVISLSNESDSEWMYGYPFHLEVNIDRTWYQLPFMPEGGTFALVGFVLGSGQTHEMRFNLMSDYGVLPPGNYRLVYNGMILEHTIE